MSKLNRRFNEKILITEEGEIISLDDDTKEKTEKRRITKTIASLFRASNKNTEDIIDTEGKEEEKDLTDEIWSCLNYIKSKTCLEVKNVKKAGLMYEIEGQVLSIEFNKHDLINIVNFYLDNVLELRVTDSKVKKNDIKIFCTNIDLYKKELDEIKNEEERGYSSIFLPVGFRKDGKTHFINLEITPHIILTAPAGRGKSSLAKSIVTMYKSIHGDNFSLYDITGVKKDFFIFHNMSNTKGVYSLNGLENLKKLDSKLKDIIKEASEREAYFIKNKYANIASYVAKNKYYELFYKPTFLIIDEFPIITANANNKTEEGKLYDSILKSLITISNQGRSSGFYLMLIVQKATSDSIPTSILHNSARISLAQPTRSAAVAALGEEAADYALKLGDREAAVISGSDVELIVVPYTNNIVIEKVLGDKLFENLLTTSSPDELIKLPSIKSKAIKDLNFKEVKKLIENKKLEKNVKKQLIKLSQLTESEKEELSKKLNNKIVSTNTTNTFGGIKS
ncbi:hypothetical protein [Clostridium sp.]|uniref:hypothetical protein n=1 Tax=Clostridium sp. TaxID=1506 RepID=UPI001B4FEB5F|nr:hypothetical protein [Clostridium sp.]MBP3915682.1 hypothetical protein [Clostridium sp.]